MKNSILKTNYEEFFLNEEKDILYAKWFVKSEKMTSDGFKEEMNHELALIEEHRVKKYLVDVKDFRFTIDNDLQEWTDQNVNKQLDHLGLEKLAYVTSEDFIAQLSIELTMDESKKENYDTKFFDSIEKAEEWLLL